MSAEQTGQRMEYLPIANGVDGATFLSTRIPALPAVSLHLQLNMEYDTVTFCGVIVLT